MIFNTIVAGSGIDTSDATASPENIDYGYTAYVNGEMVTGSHVCPDSINIYNAEAGVTCWSEAVEEPVACVSSYSDDFVEVVIDFSVHGESSQIICKVFFPTDQNHIGVAGN